MARPPLSHYSPKFANKAWADTDYYTSYFSCPHSLEIKKSPMGWKQWGRKRGIYSWDVENSLAQNLENETKPIYEKICSYQEITFSERIAWSQFILSQLVRTPTFMRYENKMSEIFGIIEKPKHDRVGCKECGDLNYVANRDWCLLISHKDDFFVRSDNPVLQTGFIERPETCLFYPMTPNLCFVACSMPKNWNPLSDKPKETWGYKLSKGIAHLFNFYLAKAADESLIISPKHDGIVAEKMFSNILGIYPQPPFLLHILNSNLETNKAFESIRILMSETDGVKYPSWHPTELEPFYQTKHCEDIA